MNTLIRFFNCKLYKTCVDELPEGSLKLLVISSFAKDVLLQSKESISELRITVRRKKTGDSSECLGKISRDLRS